MRRLPVPHLPGRRPQWLAVLAVGVVAVPLGLLAVYGTGYPPARLTLAGGTAWLASPGHELVTLVDGPSELVVGSVKTPVRDGGLVQVGSSALLVDRDAGTVRRLDGATYEVSDPVQFSTDGGLTVLAGRSTAYLVDTARGTASSLDPGTLRAGTEVPLAAAPGPGQAVVDDAQRLWVVEGATGGLAGIAPDGARARARSTGIAATSRLAVVQGRPAVLDPVRRAAGWVGDDAGVRQWSCFQATDSPEMQLLGSATSPRLYAADPQTGTLSLSDLATGACPAGVRVGRPGDHLGPIVESNGFVLVPNETTGKLVVVDVTAGAVRTELAVLPQAAGRLELVAKDGLVFYNDLAGERAGVIRFDGQFSADSAGDKFRVRDGQPDTVLTPGSGDAPSDSLPSALPARGGVGTGRAAAVRPAGPAVTGGPPAVVVPGPTTTTPPTTTTTPPTTVLIPDFSSVLHQSFTGSLLYINDQIAQTCGGKVCLKPVAVPGAPVGADAVVEPGGPPPPCLINSIPAAGTPVERGSTLTFGVDRPCDDGTTPITTTTTSPVTTTTTPPVVTTTPPVVEPQPGSVEGTTTTKKTTTSKKTTTTTTTKKKTVTTTTDANDGE
jgi:hypothetical protein